MVLDFNLPYNSAHPPGFLIQEDNELLASSLGEGVDSNFDGKKVKDEVTLDADQLQNIVSALKRATEVTFFLVVVVVVVVVVLLFFIFFLFFDTTGCERELRKHSKEIERDFF